MLEHYLLARQAYHGCEGIHYQVVEFVVKKDVTYNGLDFNEGI